MDAITDAQRAVLKGIADDLRSGAIPDTNFDMSKFSNLCGTTHCIGGWARARAPRSFTWRRICCDGRFADLFFPGHKDECEYCGYRASGAQAARAIDNFLKDGNPRWADVMAEDDHA